MKLRWQVLLPIVLVLAIVVYLFIRKSSGSTAADAARRVTAPLVKLEQPKRRTMDYSLHFTGDVLPIQQAGIFAKVTGTLERVYVDMGSEVRRGQLMAMIDTTELAQQYQQASATFENARINYRRSKELFEQNLVARQELDNAEAALKVATATFEAARTRLSYASITAPFSGYVTRRFLDPGTVVSQNNATLFTLMDVDQLKITISVLEKDIPRISRGKTATVTVDAFPGKEFTGKVARYSEAVDPGTRTMAVELDIDNPAHLLKPGMFANVTLVVEEHQNALTVPTASILKDDRGSYVFTAVGDTAKRVPIQPGLEGPDFTEVRAGIEDGSPIITTGQQFVRDRGPVTVQK